MYNLGSWGLAAETFHQVTCVAVELDDMAAKALRANNVAREVINTAVGDLAWREGEPWSVAMASPPCPCFNTLKGSPGLGHPSAEAWSEAPALVHPHRERHWSHPKVEPNKTRTASNC